MKRLVVILVAVCMIGSVAILISGCGQTTPQIKTEVSTVPQPKGLTIRGTVYVEGLSGNLKNPLAGVALTLNGGVVTADGRATYTRVTTSDANGGYVFTDLPQSAAGVSIAQVATIQGQSPFTPSGNTIVAVKDGYQRQITSNISLSGSKPLSDNSEINVDIVMSSNPIVLSMSPLPGSTIEAAANTIVVNFNEAMDKPTVRPELNCEGVRDYAIGDTQTLTCTWSADSKTLYVTTGSLLPNKVYQLMIDPNNIAKDVDGYTLDTNGGYNAGGLSQYIYNGSYGEGYYYVYRTSSGGAPDAPTGVLLTVDTKNKIDFNDVVSYSNPVKLSWLAPVTGSLPSGYKIYISNSATGPWEQLGDSVTENRFNSTILDVNRAIYGPYWDINTSYIKQLAFVVDTVYFKVVAFNAEGEGASAVVSMRDSVGPSIRTVAMTPSAAGIPWEIASALPYYFDGGSATYEGCYVQFTEPMDPDSLTDVTKYTISSGQTVESAALVYENNGVYVAQLTFSASVEPNVNVLTVEAISTGPKDLSGNMIDATGNTAIIYDGN